jgi:hypothetical protein
VEDVSFIVGAFEIEYNTSDSQVMHAFWGSAKGSILLDGIGNI